MENPSTWTKLEKTIYEAIREAEDQRARRVIGLSTTRIIADALRREGLVEE